MTGNGRSGTSRELRADEGAATVRRRNILASDHVARL